MHLTKYMQSVLSNVYQEFETMRRTKLKAKYLGSIITDV